MFETIPKPRGAIDYINRRKKHLIETEKWDTLKWAEHSHCFTVAHSIGYEILEDISGALSEALEEGKTYQDFKREMLENPKIVKWAGGKDQGSKDLQEVYLKWRLKTIFITNDITAFNAGRYRQQKRVSRTRPYWQYNQIQRDSKRKGHEKFHLIILSADDPLWDEIYPPNGWHCGCYVTTLTRAKAMRLGISDPGNVTVIKDDMNIPGEWRYNVGKAYFYPEFTPEKFPNLAGVQTREGKNVLTLLEESYREGLKESIIPQVEFNNLVDSIFSSHYTPDENPLLIETLDVKALGKVKKLTGKPAPDGRIILTDRVLAELKNQLSPDQMKGLKKVFKSPGSITREGEHIVFKTKNYKYYFKFRPGSTMEFVKIFLEPNKP